MRTYGNKINKYFAVAIENNDFSGLDQDEINLIKDFLKNKKDLVFLWENVNFLKCSVSKLYGDCIEAEWN